MLAQVLHQVYGGGILAVIMHHTAQFLDEVRLWLSFWTRLNTGTDDAILPWLSSWTRF